MGAEVTVKTNADLHQQEIDANENLVANFNQRVLDVAEKTAQLRAVEFTLLKNAAAVITSQGFDLTAYDMVGIFVEGAGSIVGAIDVQTPLGGWVLLDSRTYTVGTPIYFGGANMAVRFRITTYTSGIWNITGLGKCTSG